MDDKRTGYRTSPKPDDEVEAKPDAKVEAKLEAKATAKAEAIEPSSSKGTVRIVMTAGPDGGEPRGWMIGAPLLKGAYHIKPGEVIAVMSDDAKVLLGNSEKLGGRKFTEALVNHRPKG